MEDVPGRECEAPATSAGRIEWTHPYPYLYVSPDGAWALDHLLQDGVRPGWYLIGAGCGEGRWLDRWPEMALVEAEKYIAAREQRLGAVIDTTSGEIR